MCTNLGVYASGGGSWSPKSSSGSEEKATTKQPEMNGRGANWKAWAG